MHELALTEGVLSILEDQAKARNYTRVRTVWLDLGELSHADPDAITFCFDAVMRGTLADGAKLEIVRTPGEAWCLGCDRTVSISQRFDPCPTCGSHRLQVTKGGDMRILELEVE